MGKLTRRCFLIQTSSTVAATAAGRLVAAEYTPSAVEDQIDAYQTESICKLAHLTVLEPFLFHYPDAASACYLLKLGQNIETGIGPEGDLVAFSAHCPHMGCGLTFNAEQKCLECPCHFSIFDCEQGGRMVIGQATQDLPQIMLRYDPISGDILATGVLGMLYGRVTNVLADGGA
jgi:arsenite oxidase small subunit